jgi:hypothetical protein
MSTMELKEMLIGKINALEDEELLREIALTFEVQSRMVDGVYTMSPEEIEAVNDGIQQMENGQSVSNDEVRRRINKLWGK